MVLLTDDKACQGKAQSDGLLALRAAEFVEKMRKKFLRCDICFDKDTYIKVLVLV